MFNMDYKYYTDESLNACIMKHTYMKLILNSFVPLKDEDLEEVPIPPKGRMTS